jgi:hypothetical protein
MFLNFKIIVNLRLIMQFRHSKIYFVIQDNIMITKTTIMDVPPINNNKGKTIKICYNY